MKHGADSRLARMLRGELPEEERRELESRFLEDDALFHELSREEEDLLEAWEDGELDERTAEAVDGLLRTSTRVQTLVDVTLSLDETGPAIPASARPEDLTPVQALLAHRSLPWIAWGLVVVLALALTIVLAMQVRIVRLLDQQLEGARWEQGATGRRGPEDSGARDGGSIPSVTLDSSNREREIRSTFDRRAGLRLEITLARTLLSGTYFVELEPADERSGVRQIDVPLERTLFPGGVLIVTIPPDALEPGVYTVTLQDEARGSIASWVLQLEAT